MPSFLAGRLLVAGALLAFLGVSGSMLSSLVIGSDADMRIEPSSGIKTVGETFTIDIVVESNEPVNVFKGNLAFDPEILLVETIGYNTSIADLWAERPWFSNGDGTLNFIGGTTDSGGFTGEGNLITVTFKTRREGSAVIAMDEVRILRHDGLGSDVTVKEPIDAIFEVDETVLQGQTVLQKSLLGPKVEVVAKPPDTDLNSDGKQTLADTSIFMQHLLLQNLRSDFNQDGRVNTIDLSILMEAS